MLILCSLIVTGRSVKRMLGLNSSLGELSRKVYTGIQRNQKLRDKLSALRSDQHSLDATARSTLGVVGPNEIVYVFPTLRRGEKRPPAGRTPPPSARGD